MNQTTANGQAELFGTETAGLPAVASPGMIRLHDEDHLDLRIGSVRKTIDGAELRMLAYNGSVPGPNLCSIKVQESPCRCETTATSRPPCTGTACGWRTVTTGYRDRETGATNGDITWAFTVGDQVKIRLINEMDSDHPMHHPFHIHGAGRFLILSRDDEPEANLVWKDTVLVRAGETVDILLDISNPGLWMAHCHIAEHNQGGMMFSFNVTRDQEPVR